jgi:hypothetical protein
MTIISFKQEETITENIPKVLRQDSPERAKGRQYLDKILNMIENKDGDAIKNEIKDLPPEQRDATLEIIEGENIPDEDKKYFRDIIKHLIIKVVPETEKSREELEAELAEAKQKIAELVELREINEGRALTKEKIKAILSDIEGFEFFSRTVDLGKPTKKLPHDVPPEKKWDARSHKYNGMTPEEKATRYLKENWMNYPVNLSYFKHSNIGNGFFSYLVRNEIDYILPTACEQEMKKRLEEMK